jgi:deoxyribonucleoside regulator
MSDRIDQTAALVAVARSYYEENLSQLEIAKKLGVSRSLVALYLKRARDLGIVNIQIVDPSAAVTDLESALQHEFSLSVVKVVPSAQLSPALVRSSLGAAVARHLDQTLRDGDVLGIGWGRTLSEIPSSLTPAAPRRIEVVPVLGESGNTGSYTQINQIVLHIARAFQGTPHFLVAPVLVHSEELRRSLLADPSAWPVVNSWNRLDVACLGIGTLPAVGGQIDYIGETQTAGLSSSGAVGDLCARYYNIDGEFLEAEFYTRLVAIHLEQLSRTPRRIVVAGGVDKLHATLGVLRTGLVTEFILDSELALRLLSENSSIPRPRSRSKS